MKIIKQFILGSASTNNFLINHQNQNILIDAGENIKTVIDYLDKENIKLDYILLTHGHYDHIAGLNQLKDQYPNVKIYISPEEVDYLTRPEFSLSSYFGVEFSYQGEINTLDNLDLTGITVDYISGHSKQGALLTFDDAKIMFSGDTLFMQSIGRFDFIHGNQASLIAGIQEKIMTKDEEIVVYPGHGFKTTIKKEKIDNNLIK